MDDKENGSGSEVGSWDNGSGSAEPPLLMIALPGGVSVLACCIILCLVLALRRWRSGNNRLVMQRAKSKMGTSAELLESSGVVKLTITEQLVRDGNGEPGVGEPEARAALDPARAQTVRTTRTSAIGSMRRQSSTPMPRQPPPAAQQQAAVSLMAEIRRNRKLVPAAAGASGELVAQPDASSHPPPLLPADAPKVMPALNELVVTERAYVQQLHTLVHHYLPALREVLEPAETKTVFANCAILLGVNEGAPRPARGWRALRARRPRPRHLLCLTLCTFPAAALLAKLTDALETSPSADVGERVFQVAEAFLTMLHFLKAYAQYCAGYFAALELLTRLRAERAAVEAAVRAVETRLRLVSGPDADLSLSACLIRPVKRLCLYPLLLNAVLEALRRATAGEPTKRPGYELLEKAADKVQSMALNVNDLVRQAESQIRMLAVHERLRGSYPGLLDPARRLVREEKLQILKRAIPGCGLLQAYDELDGVIGSRFVDGGGGGKIYQLWLFNDRLLLARPDRFSDQFFHLKEDMPLEQLRLAWPGSNCGASTIDAASLAAASIAAGEPLMAPKARVCADAVVARSWASNRRRTSLSFGLQARGEVTASQAQAAKVLQHAARSKLLKSSGGTAEGASPAGTGGGEKAHCCREDAAGAGASNEKTGEGVEEEVTFLRPSSRSSAGGASSPATSAEPSYDEATAPAAEPTSPSFWILLGETGFLVQCGFASAARSLYDAIDVAARAHVDLASTLEKRTAKLEPAESAETPRTPGPRQFGVSVSLPRARNCSVARSCPTSSAGAAPSKGFLSWLVGKAAVSAAAAERAIAQERASTALTQDGSERRPDEASGAEEEQESVEPRHATFPRRSSLPQVTLNTCTLDPRWVRGARDEVSSIAEETSAGASSPAGSAVANPPGPAEGGLGLPSSVSGGELGVEQGVGASTPRSEISSRTDASTPRSEISSRTDASTPRKASGSTQGSSRSSTMSEASGGRAEYSVRASKAVATARWHQATVGVATESCRVSECRKKSASSDPGVSAFLMQARHTASLIEQQGDAINQVLQLRRVRSSAEFRAVEDERPSVPEQVQASGSSMGALSRTASGGSVANVQRLQALHDEVLSSRSGHSSVFAPGSSSFGLRGGASLSSPRRTLSSGVAVILEEGSSPVGEAESVNKETRPPIATAVEGGRRPTRPVLAYSPSLALAGVPYATEACIQRLPSCSGFSEASVSARSSLGDAAAIDTRPRPGSAVDAVVVQVVGAKSAPPPPPHAPPLAPP